MTSMTLSKGMIRGMVTVPPSKSMTHRAVISACLANGVSMIENVILSDDIVATCNGMRALGASIGYLPQRDQRMSLRINGVHHDHFHTAHIDCNESGSTLRFLIPISALTHEMVTFHGKGQLISRPLSVYTDIFEEKKIAYHYPDNTLPISISGPLPSGEYRVRGDISSQFISGLMMALPLLKENSRIQVVGAFESIDYVKMTLSTLKCFGVSIDQVDDQCFHVQGNQVYTPQHYVVEGDYSQAAFWIVAATLFGDLLINGISCESLQGDQAILDIVSRMGGHFEWVSSTELKVFQAKTKGIEIDVTHIPDLVPILAVLASYSEGFTHITGGKRVRLKESDRLLSTATELNKLGCKIELLEDGLRIEGVKHLNAASVSSWGDHRIAMALGIAAMGVESEIVLEGFEHVKKSYPGFWEDYQKVGGICHGSNTGSRL